MSLPAFDDAACLNNLPASASRAAVAVKPALQAGEGIEAEPITTFAGRRLHVAFPAAPVIDLNRSTVAGRRIEPRLTCADTGEPLSVKERTALLAADMERVDTATLERGIARLEAGPVRGEHPSLILTMSFFTASSQRARTRLLGRPGPLRDAVRASVIWLLTDLPDGAPPSRLAEVAALLRPFGRAVFAATHPAGATLKAARAARISGLVMEPATSRISETDTALWLLQAGKLAEGAAPTLIAANLASANLLPMAAAAGFTHATVREDAA